MLQQVGMKVQPIARKKILRLKCPEAKWFFAFSIDFYLSPYRVSRVWALGGPPAFSPSFWLPILP